MTNKNAYIAQVIIGCTAETSTEVLADIRDDITLSLQDNGDSEYGLGSYDLMDLTLKPDVTPQAFTHRIYDLCNKYSYDLMIDADGEDIQPGVIYLWIEERRNMSTEELTTDFLISL